MLHLQRLISLSFFLLFFVLPPKAGVICIFNDIGIKPPAVGVFAMNKICGIYKITNPKGKVYIGQSVNVKSRFSKYKHCKCHQQPLLFNSLKKYGSDKHKFEILEQCLVEELDEKEKYYIELYQSFNSEYGLNLQSGGYNRFTFTEAVSKKRSETMKRIGHRPPISKGNANCNYGKPVPEERKQKQVASLKSHNKSLSEDVKLDRKLKQGSAMRQAWKGNPERWEKNRRRGKESPRSKPIAQYTKSGSFIKNWHSARDAATELEINYKGISACLTSRIPSYKGFTWKFIITNQ